MAEAQYGHCYEMARTIDDVLLARRFFIFLDACSLGLFVRKPIIS
jgi:glycerol-3-phosphate dehydrogenase